MDLVIESTGRFTERTGAEKAKGKVIPALDGKLTGYSEEPLGSSDYRCDSRSAVVDAQSTLVIGGRMVKVLDWYDNEWGFSNRLVDLSGLIETRV